MVYTSYFKSIVALYYNLLQIYEIITEAVSIDLKN